MDRSAVHKRLAETEEQIAGGQHQVAQQRELSSNSKPMDVRRLMPNISWMGLSCCKLPGGIVAIGFSNS
jgi:hypothetical protein